MGVHQASPGQEDGLQQQPDQQQQQQQQQQQVSMITPSLSFRPVLETVGVGGC